MEDGEEDEDEEIPLDMEEVEAASKKARQDDEIHSEHIQVHHLLIATSVSLKLYFCSRFRLCHG